MTTEKIQASEQLERKDDCAALMLVKWATVTVDTTRHSLSYQKPKLAKKVAHLQLLAEKWMAKHTAYLPLLIDVSCTAVTGRTATT